MCNQLKNKLLALAGANASIRSHNKRDWSSATFSGEKHTIEFFFTDLQDADAFVDMISEEELDIEMTGQLLCDLRVTSEDAIIPLAHSTVMVEALTLNGD